MQISVPAETTACALGADAVAAALQDQLQQRGSIAEVIRTGSRGAFFLEPLVEVVDGGRRLAFGSVSADQVTELFDGAGRPAHDHPLCIGNPDEHPWFAAQQRLTFARIGKMQPLDFAAYVDMNGLTALRAALAMSADEVIDAVTASGLRGRGGAAFPAGIKWRTVADQAAVQ